MTMLSLQIVLPMDPLGPRTFFELVVGYVLDRVVAADLDGIEPLVPSAEPVHLELMRLNPWVRKAGRGHSAYRVAWHPDEWMEFRTAVDRHFDTAGMVAFRQRPPEDDSLSFLVRFDTIPAGDGLWHVLGLRLVADTEADRAVLPAAADPLLVEGLVAQISDELRPMTFAALGSHALKLHTGWETLLGVKMAEALEASREYLRGYDWITYCPPVLLDRIGGVAGARASGAFHDVREITEKLVALQATETPEQYGAAVRRVHEVLAPILTPGVPRPGIDVMPRAYNPAGSKVERSAGQSR